MIKFYDFKREYLEQKKIIDLHISHCLNSGIFILGPQVKTLEKRLAKLMNCNYAVGVGNGLDAIEIALKSFGIGQGDEVITTPLSAFPTTLALINLGAIPVFADIDIQTGLMNVEKISSLISKKTKAIVPVNLYGQMVDVDAIRKIAKKHKLIFIEDSAQAISAKKNKISTGQYSDAACLSFYPTKNLGAYGDGGAIVTNSKRAYKNMLALRNYGEDKKYHHVLIGKNSRLDELQASILLAKLKSLNQNIKKRRKIAFKYINSISNPKINLLKTSPNSYHTFHLFIVKTPYRNQLKNFLYKNGVETLIHYPLPIYRQPAMNKIKYKLYCDKNKVNAFCKQIISLPIHPYLKNFEIEKIIKLLNKF